MERLLRKQKRHPVDEAENVIFDANNDVIKIGKILTNKDDVHGEFIGMMKLSPRAKYIKDIFIDQKKFIGTNHFNVLQYSKKAILQIYFKKWLI